MSEFTIPTTVQSHNWIQNLNTLSLPFDSLRELNLNFVEVFAESIMEIYDFILFILQSSCG